MKAVKYDLFDIALYFIKSAYCCYDFLFRQLLCFFFLSERLLSNCGMRDDYRIFQIQWAVEMQFLAYNVKVQNLNATNKPVNIIS